MGYGLGVFLIVVGLILTFAVQDAVDVANLATIGWILTGGGVLVIALTAIQMNSRRSQRSVATTTHSDGSQTVAERRTDQDPPAQI